MPELDGIFFDRELDGRYAAVVTPVALAYSHIWR